jgi:hypothetical protein
MRDAGAVTYETHLTVGCGDQAGVEALREWARAGGVKFTHIVLARGRTVSQPMLTVRGGGGVDVQRDAAEALAGRLRADGFDPVRVKIEAPVWAPEVPRANSGATSGRYFEHHLKLVLDAGFDRDRLVATVAGHRAHVSWNARRELDGQHERFVTQRCHGVGAPTAAGQLDALIGDVTRAEYRITSVEREFVLYDSDLTVDDGWIEEATA